VETEEIDEERGKDGRGKRRASEKKEGRKEGKDTGLETRHYQL